MAEIKLIPPMSQVNIETIRTPQTPYHSLAFEEIVDKPNFPVSIIPLGLIPKHEYTDNNYMVITVVDSLALLQCLTPKELQSSYLLYNARIKITNLLGGKLRFFHYGFYF